MSADRTARQYWSCQSALVANLGAGPSQFHHIMVHVANHLGMKNRSVEGAVLRRQSHRITTSLPIYVLRITAAGLIRN
jgi:hypothetical protein